MRISSTATRASTVTASTPWMMASWPRASVVLVAAVDPMEPLLALTVNSAVVGFNFIIYADQMKSSKVSRDFAKSREISHNFAKPREILKFVL